MTVAPDGTVYVAALGQNGLARLNGDTLDYLSWNQRRGLFRRQDLRYQLRLVLTGRAAGAPASAFCARRGDAGETMIEPQCKLVRIVTAIVAISVVSAMAIAAVVYIKAEMAYQYRQANFCTLNDEVYQAIVAHHEEWGEYYRPLIVSTGFASPHLVINVPSGKSYTVNADLWAKGSDAPIFYLVTETVWQENFGNNGYFYSPESPPHLDSRYHIEAISDDIYCYRFKTREEYAPSS